MQSFEAIIVISSDCSSIMTIVPYSDVKEKLALEATDRLHP